MIPHLSHVMTLANGVIGVSVLAMPFCFKQCGIILAILLLLLSSILSRLACHFLLKSAVLSRRRNFEFLAFHAFGRTGKFLVELFIIGFLLGTCIAFFVVVGDLAPAIIGKVLNKSPENIRTSLLITTGIFIVLPLGLLRNIDSLSSISTATIVFYFCLVLKVMGESTQHIFAGDWYEHVFFWRPAGILQCLPIFSMALFCQTQLFQIYESVPNVSLEKMNEIVKGALNICTIVYISVGLFGYIACCTQPFTGNILMSFQPSPSSEVIKLFFVFSVAFSFPLVIFPCRASLNSLLFRRAYLHESSSGYMTETRFRFLTLLIVSISLIMGILIPNIEFVLGIVGATIGVMICLIFPATFFISISNKNTNERLLAQVIAFVGLLIMILGTYVNLHLKEETLNPRIVITTDQSVDQINILPFNLMKDNIPVIPEISKKLDFSGNNKELNVVPEWNNPKDIPIPALPKEITQKSDVKSSKVKNKDNSIPETNKIENINNVNGDSVKESKVEYKTKENDPVILKEDSSKVIEVKDKVIDSQKGENLINSDAIKKEESELAADGELAHLDVAQKHEELKRTLEKYKKEQREMMQEQKEILKDIKEQQLELQKEKKERLSKGPEAEKKSDQMEKKEEVKIKNSNVKENNSIVKEEIIVEGKKPAEIGENNEKSEINIKKDNPESKKQNSSKLEESVFRNDKEVKDPVKSIIISQPLKSELEDKKQLKDNSILDSGKKTSDHILNALTNKKAVNNIVKDDKEEKEIVQKSDSVSKKDSLNENKEINRFQEYSIPIALKMNNQTKGYNDSERLTIEKKKEYSVVHRDILENHEREKRDADDAVIIETKVEKENSDGDKIAKICEKENKIFSDKHIKEDPLKVVGIKHALIVTNSYLSQQSFTEKISIDSNLDVSGKMVKLKKRDLKYVKSDENKK